MAHLLKDYRPSTSYRYSKSGYNDRRQKTADQLDPESDKRLKNSTTLYVGNLTFFTTEEQILELFSKTGEIKRLIMGLNRETKTPCGFCFVEYYTHQEASECMKFLNGARLDDRPLRVDWDEGFRDGRQWGRGLSGGQVRDEFRADYDPGRGGFGFVARQNQNQNQNQNQISLQQEAFPKRRASNQGPEATKKFQPEPAIKEEVEVSVHGKGREHSSDDDDDDDDDDRHRRRSSRSRFRAEREDDEED